MTAAVRPAAVCLPSAVCSSASLPAVRRLAARSGRRRRTLPPSARSVRRRRPAAPRPPRRPAAEPGFLKVLSEDDRKFLILTDHEVTA
ncbi:hypothetical protein [Streptomyces sp. x-19]|uniref:hypothetical protein n=1 Tax=Streptomyces sp. x-19 TaxID=2789280 RepID=UPI003980DB6B